MSKENKVVKKQDLVKYITAKTNLKSKDVKLVIEEFKNFVMESCKNGYDVELISFINFRNKVLKGGLRTNFQTKERKMVPDMNIVKVSLSGKSIKNINR